MVKSFVSVAATALLLVVFCTEISEQKSLQLSLHKTLQDGVARLVRNVENTEADTHDHEDSHGHEVAPGSSCSITEETLLDEFNELAELMGLLDDSGDPCFLEGAAREGHSSGEEEEEEEGHLDDHDKTSHGEMDVDYNVTEFGGNVTCSSCDTVYEFFKELVFHVGMVPECCLNGNGTECENTGNSNNERPTAAQAYGYGFLMVIVVCSAAFAGLLVVPCVQGNKRFAALQKYVYFFMIALGASALFCDAVLHLIPEAFGLHGHGEAEGGGAHEHQAGEKEPIPDYIWKGCAVIAGMYIFFLLEVVLHAWNSHRHGHAHNQNSDSLSEGNDKGEDSPLKGTTFKLEETDTPPLEVTFPHGTCKETTGSGPKMLHPSAMEATENCVDCKAREDCERCDEKETKDLLQSNCCVRVWHYIQNIKPLAWLIIIGDCLHNFADGLALGAAISQSLSLGISLKIALIFHEIPHEFGDFVILLSTGMTWKVAILFNLLSASTAIIGFFVGVAVGTISEDVNSWILAVTSGVFLYIALVDLLPELIHSKEKGCIRWGLFLMTNIGFVISFIILLVIAIYEEELNMLVS